MEKTMKKGMYICIYIFFIYAYWNVPIYVYN